MKERKGEGKERREKQRAENKLKVQSHISHKFQ